MQTLAAGKNQSWLTWFLKGLLVLGFLVLLARLIELQVIKGDYYRNLSDNNRIRKVIVYAPRGRILARGGEVLVANKPVTKEIIFDAKEGYLKSTVIKEGASENLITEWEREYPLGANAFHLLGYLGEANTNEVGKINPKCPEKGAVKPGQMIGRMGLEAQYECELAGVPGEEIIEVDTQGKKVRILGRKKAVPGQDITTSIDFGLQAKSETFMQGAKGALVISDGQGGVLTLFSSPSFDPNFFNKQDKAREVNEVLLDKTLPLFNRSIGGLFHPGSVFKPVVILAALSEGAITKDFVYDDPGVIAIDKYSYANWYFTQYGGKEGLVGIEKALARSTDTFFYKVGEMTGPDKIADFAEIFGLNKETGIDLPGEIVGLIPTPVWKERVKKESWFLGNTYHMAIGQGDMAVTPAEINVMTSTIANGGDYCSLKVAKQKADNCRKVKVRKDFFDIVKSGMVKACLPGGTGYTFFDFKPQVACKTGTAETNLDGKTHAWFSVFAPVEFPEIVATVLVEQGGEGSKIAGPIARKVFDYWFLGKE